MSKRPFRFLHASDFRLDEVPGGLTDVPDSLRDTLLDAAYQAALRVFDVAVVERVPFLLLSGNILAPERTGPRGPAFLLEQFERLANEGINVYWAGGQLDPPESWPDVLPLPGNVHRFPKDGVTDCLVDWEGSPIARIAGSSRGSVHVGHFVADPVGLYTIAVTCGEPDGPSMESQGVDYWALGGRAERSTPRTSPCVVHYPGTPQGRSPAALGPHGCTLVSVDDAGRTRLSPISCSAVQWLQEDLQVAIGTRREDLESSLTQRIRALTQGLKAALLVSWSIRGTGPLLGELRRGKLRGELLDWLRIEYGLSPPVVWSVDLEGEPGGPLPASLYEQETILGDFLRALRQHEADPQLPLNVEDLLADGKVDEALARSAALADGPARRRVLREAALLGLELLGGEPAEPA